VSTIIRVRAVEEAAIGVLAEVLANTYHWGGGRSLRPEFYRWYHRRPAEKKRWQAVAKLEGYSSLAAYREAWERINGGGSWFENLIVWVVEFEVVKP
jgi:hypothetical protein